MGQLKKDGDELNSGIQGESLAPKPLTAAGGSFASASDTMSDLVVKNGAETLPLAIDWPLAASIMAGDFFHNFAGTYTDAFLLLRTPTFRCAS
jgi:hypothetical protein